MLVYLAYQSTKQKHSTYMNSNQTKFYFGSCGPQCRPIQKRNLKSVNSIHNKIQHTEESLKLL